jgi:hypothetical protein
MKTQSPYIRARQEWDERFGDRRDGSRTQGIEQHTQLLQPHLGSCSNFHRRTASERADRLTCSHPELSCTDSKRVSGSAPAPAIAMPVFIGIRVKLQLYVSLNADP